MFLPVEHLAWTSKHLLFPSMARGLAALHLFLRAGSELQSGPRASLGGAPGALQVVPQVPEAERRCRFPDRGRRVMGEGRSKESW